MKDLKKFIVKKDEQIIDFPGVYNARQLGGYPTLDGTTVKRNKLFRSGMLMNSKYSSEEMNQQLNIKCIIDLRTSVEHDTMPNPTNNEIRYEKIDISPIEIMNDFEKNNQLPNVNVVYNDRNLEQIKNLDCDNYQVGLYEYYAESSIAKKAYRDLFDILLSEDDGAFLFHCYQGKDRTGIVASLILSALDVPQSIILQDYLLTNELMKNEIEVALASAKLETSDQTLLRSVLRMFGVEKIMFDAFLKKIKKRNETINHFLSKEVGLSEVEKKELKRKFTE